ncbi:prepilin peptidase [Kribbella shirazensis]|uniref:Leader peptidase (Prepilin peptidase)/N-methyltransferase n=1 Tax=Kribbella shirazensis TaxID=1105143 RepID=A0A7X5VDP2_9ACTN|nr:A24 family peptidase [Kribbella shirazensis]NIK59099.1 leader peptidase (prepilin peptidase)/N-methyltransferase [Kribbella shirazensis]
MDITWSVAGGTVGVVAGLLLRGTVFRLSVAPGSPDRSACARCAAPVGGRFAVRCAQCGGWYGVPLVLEALTAAVFAVLMWRFGGLPEIAPYAFVGALGVALAVVDIDVQRLPNALTLPLYPGLVALFGLVAVVDGRPGDLMRAMLGGLVLGGCYLALAVASSGRLGGGDVKLAGGLGIALGWLGWPTLLVGALLGFLIMGAVGAVLVAARRVTLQQAISFGPFMLGGALVAVVASS